MAEWIYVVEALTDGSYGFPLDRIAEIGIARADVDSGNVESVYSSRVMLDEGSFTTKQKDYLRDHFGLTPSDLADAPDQSVVIEEVAGILAGKTVTSFNIGIPINKFLALEPWGLTHMMTVMSSVGAGVPEISRGRDHADSADAIDFCYRCMFPDDIPAAGGGRGALDLAIRTAHMMLKIRNP